MLFEDRVVGTGLLQEYADDDSGMLAVPAGLLARVAAGGMHVLVPRGPAPLPGEVLMCEAQLDTGGATPTRIPLLVPLAVWRRLPTAFAVLSAAARLVPAVPAAAAKLVGEPIGDVGDDVEDESGHDEFGSWPGDVWRDE